MYRGLFITGTDTNVGKTIVSSALMHRYRGLAPLRYWKPIQTGAEKDDDTAVVRDLGACSDLEVMDKGYRLMRPVSPHLAAELSERRINIPEIERWMSEESGSSSWIVEGAGGVLVPINSWELMIDLMIHLTLPVLVVARSSIGTINHTLLTLEAIRNRAVQIAGIVMIGDKNPENRAAIERFGRVDVLGEMPRVEKLTAQTLGEWARADLDREGRLAEFLA
jgi:dethiobiotin synthase